MAEPNLHTCTRASRPEKVEAGACWVCDLNAREREWMKAHPDAVDKGPRIGGRR